MMDLLCFLILGLFFHFIVFGLSPSGLRSDGFFLFFLFGASSSTLLPFWLSPFGLGYDRFFFLIWGFFF